MRSEARKETGESLLDHMQVFARGDRETVMAELIMPVNVVLWRGGAVIRAAATPDEELDYLTHHRIFACLSGNCGLQKITLETERVSEEEMMNRQSHVDERNRPIAAGSEHFSEYFETVIIGGGQAGLSVGYHLKRQGRPFVILDANERIGDAWRKRWDSLRLFTPARYSGLAGWRFPAPAVSFPTKDEMADYLESYAARFDLPVRTGVKVDGLFRGGIGSSLHPATAVSKRNTWSSRRAPTKSRRCPLSPMTSVRPSCSRIRVSTATPLSSRKAPFWWWARATLERRSLSKCPVRIPHTCRASPQDRSPSVTDPLRRGSSSP
jgi:hypothetical protein